MSNHQGDAATTARKQEPNQNQAAATEEVTQSTLSEQQSGNVPAPSAERQSELAHPTAEQAQPEREPATGSDAEAQATQSGQASAQPAPSHEASAQLASSSETSTQPSSESAGQPSQSSSSESSAQATQSAPSTEASAQPASSSEAPAQSAPKSELSTETPVQSAAAPATPDQTGDQEEGVANSANVQAAAPAQESTLGEFDPRPDMSDQGFQQLLPKLLTLFENNREKLARAIGLHRSTVDRWLNGKSKPNTSTVMRMRRLAQERGLE